MGGWQLYSRHWCKRVTRFVVCLFRYIFKSTLPAAKVFVAPTGHMDTGSVEVDVDLEVAVAVNVDMDMPHTCIHICA